MLAIIPKINTHVQNMYIIEIFCIYQTQNLSYMCSTCTWDHMCLHTFAFLRMHSTLSHNSDRTYVFFVFATDKGAYTKVCRGALTERENGCKIYTFVGTENFGVIGEAV